jgi:hypothetical protein
MSKKTAREFLEWAGYEATEENLRHLSRYLEDRIDFASFPDASVCGEDGTPLSECLDEPAKFEEFMEVHCRNWFL